MTRAPRLALAFLAAAAATVVTPPPHDADAHGAAVRCRVSVTSVRFGFYNPFSPADTRANGNVVYDCSSSAPIMIAFDWGRGGGSYQARRMTNGSVALNYNLFLDPAATMIWGDGTGGSQVYSTTAPANAQTAVPVYGRIFAQQIHAPIGSYGDAITVTISF